MGRLFRRVVRSARGPRRASRGSTVRSADGKQYRVVAVNEAETAEFADPPRKWGRVGAMAGAWVVLVALGGWAAPGIAASGNPENQDPREEPITDAIGAAWSYLEYGSTQDLDLAEAALCEGASPEVTPSDLDDLRQDYDQVQGGTERINLNVEDPVQSGDGLSLAGTVFYVYDGGSPYEDFVITVQEDDGVYCVSNAVQVESEEPSDGDGTGEAADPKGLATDFMRSIIKTRDPQSASGAQCDSYTGITPVELDAAIAEWVTANGETTGFLSAVTPTESTETSVTAFEVVATLEADLKQQEFTFIVGVQEDCVTSLAGGDGLI